VSRRRDIQRRLRALGEIDGVMTAMKSLAFMEVRKLAGLLENQARAVGSIEDAAADFRRFFGERLSRPESARDTWLVVGSERGLCGDFNGVAAGAVRAAIGAGGPAPLILAIGGQLESKLRGVAPVEAAFRGATVAEEVQPVLAAALAGVADRHARNAVAAGSRLIVVHPGEDGSAIRRQLLPVPDAKRPVPARGYPPGLNLPPAVFFAQLSRHYLFAALHEVLYAALMIENRMRLEHMENALRRLDKDMAALRLRHNALRQEEIINEIEVIMLSVEALGAGEARSGQDAR